MNQKIVSLLKEKRVVFDGSMGALLSSMGVVSPCPDLVALEQPEIIRSIHRAYIDAGADVILTDTFGSSPAKLRKHGLESKLEEIVSAAVACAKAEAGTQALVALDIGPTGEMLAPMGNLEISDAIEGFRRQIRAGMDADFVLIETMTDIAEARAAMLAAKAEGFPFVASCSFEASGRTMTGGTPACAATIAEALGAVAAGMNCSGGPSHMTGPLAQMLKATALPILVEPNAGLPIMKEGKTTYPLSPEDFAKAMQSILQAGAGAVGGCCGTTPKHIQLLSDAARSFGTDERAPAAQTICSQRKTALLSDALSASETVADTEDLYDLDEDTALAVLDLRTWDADDVAEEIGVAATATHAPLGFIVGSADVLEEALRAYTGVAVVWAPEDCSEIIAKYGAIRAEE